MANIVSSCTLAALPHQLPSPTLVGIKLNCTKYVNKKVLMSILPNFMLPGLRRIILVWFHRKLANQLLVLLIMLILLNLTEIDHIAGMPSVTTESPQAGSIVSPNLTTSSPIPPPVLKSPTTPSTAGTSNKPVSLGEILEITFCEKKPAEHAKSCAVTGARVLKSAECLAIIKEKEEKRRKEQDDKEERKKIREENKKQ